MTEQTLKNELKELMDSSDDILYVHCIAKSNEDDFVIITGVQPTTELEVIEIAKNATREFHKEAKAGTLNNER